MRNCHWSLSRRCMCGWKMSLSIFSWIFWWWKCWRSLYLYCSKRYCLDFEQTLLHSPSYNDHSSWHLTEAILVLAWLMSRRVLKLELCFAPKIKIIQPKIFVIIGFWDLLVRETCIRCLPKQSSSFKMLGLHNVNSGNLLTNEATPNDPWVSSPSFREGDALNFLEWTWNI